MKLAEAPLPCSWLRTWQYRVGLSDMKQTKPVIVCAFLRVHYIFFRVQTSQYCLNQRHLSKNFKLNVVRKNCLESDLNLEKEEILMLCGLEFQILTPWYKNCCSFVLFLNGIV